MRKIAKIVIHCTATPAGRSLSVCDVRKWHRARGFKDIGYHYLIGLGGEVLAGRPESVIGAHCLGHNADSIGIAYVGGIAETGIPADTRTDAQKVAIAKLIAELKAKFPDAKVYGHNRLTCNLKNSGKVCPRGHKCFGCPKAAKACPGFDVIDEDFPPQNP